MTITSYFVLLLHLVAGFPFLTKGEGTNNKTTPKCLSFPQTIAINPNALLMEQIASTIKLSSSVDRLHRSSLVSKYWDEILCQSIALASGNMTLARQTAVFRLSQVITDSMMQKRAASPALPKFIKSTGIHEGYEILLGIMKDYNIHYKRSHYIFEVGWVMQNDSAAVDAETFQRVLPDSVRGVLESEQKNKPPVFLHNDATGHYLRYVDGCLRQESNCTDFMVSGDSGNGWRFNKNVSNSAGRLGITAGVFSMHVVGEGALAKVRVSEGAHQELDSFFLLLEEGDKVSIHTSTQDTAYEYTVGLNCLKEDNSHVGIQLLRIKKDSRDVVNSEGGDECTKWTVRTDVVVVDRNMATK